MAGFTLQIELPDNGYVEILAQNVKYWAGEGLMTYEGGLDGFNILYPAIVQHLVNKKILKETSDLH